MTKGTAWLKLCFRKDVSGSAVRNAGEGRLTLLAALNEVRPFHTKALPIWTRQGLRNLNCCTHFCKQWGFLNLDWSFGKRTLKYKQKLLSLLSWLLCYKQWIPTSWLCFSSLPSSGATRNQLSPIVFLCGLHIPLSNTVLVWMGYCDTISQ